MGVSELVDASVKNYLLKVLGIAQDYRNSTQRIYVEILAGKNHGAIPIKIHYKGKQNRDYNLSTLASPMQEI